MGLKQLTFVLGTLFLLGSFSPVQADTLSVSVDLPLSQTFNDKTATADGAPSGFALLVKLPLFVGLGVEQYDTKLKKELIYNSTTTHVLTDLYDIAYQLPIPVINITIGAGMGTTQYQCPTCVADFKFKDAKTSGTFLQLGWPILPLVDLHYAIHNIYGTVEATDLGNNAITKIDIGGTVSTLGVSVGF